MITIEILTSKIECSKCDQALKIIYDVVKAFKVTVKEIDVTNKPELIIKYQIMSTPATIINGKVVFEGIPDKKALKRRITEAIQ